MSAVEVAVDELHDLGLIEPVSGSPTAYRLSDYAATALTYVTPA